MKEKARKNYFILGKLIAFLVMFGLIIVNSGGSFMSILTNAMYFALCLCITMATELVGERRKKKAVAVAEIIVVAVGTIFLPVSGLCTVVFCIADVCVAFELPAFGLLTSYILLLFVEKQGIDLLTFFLYISFVMAAVFQEKYIGSSYREVLSQEELLQSELKTSIEKQNEFHKEEMEKSLLRNENQLLQDRNQISQALHDKLGHSINGSIYQLEAAKLLVDRKPEDCRNVLQQVIDNLRGSMDEIRALLRSRRPDKKRMAQLSIQTLCDECEDKYGIQTELVIEDENGAIPDKIWGVILDNTCEAVTNALKYSKCKKLSIDIIAMNEVVRCTIKDDGVGAQSFEDGMGLSGMKDRVRAVNGFISIDSEYGFTINMILPIGARNSL